MHGIELLVETSSTNHVLVVITVVINGSITGGGSGSITVVINKSNGDCNSKRRCASNKNIKSNTNGNDNVSNTIGWRNGNNTISGSDSQTLPRRMLLYHARNVGEQEGKMCQHWAEMICTVRPVIWA